MTYQSYTEILAEHENNLRQLITKIQTYQIINIEDDFVCLRANEYVRDVCKKFSNLPRLNEVQQLIRDYLYLSSFYRPHRNSNDYLTLVKQTATKINFSTFWVSEEIKQLKEMKNLSFKMENAWYTRFIKDVIVSIHNDSDVTNKIMHELFP